MTRSPVRNLGTFALLLFLALAFMLIAASPAWADHDHGQGQGHSGDDDDDDDDDDSSTTTTTTVAPNPTTTLAPPTTTVPPTPTTVPVWATTTTRPSTSTTTTPSTTPSTTTATTTNLVPPPRDQWEEQRPEVASTTTIPSGTQGDFDSATLVLSLALAGPGNSDGGSSGSDENGFHISPREGLTVAFRTAVEVIKGHLLSSMLLGILVAAFFLAGVDKRRGEPSVKTAPLRSFSTGRRPEEFGTSPRR